MKGIYERIFKINKIFKIVLFLWFAVPTTAGTGSEVTKATVITDTAYDVKMMLARPQLLPDTAIVDPLLTLSCPKHVTAATGIDALSHAVEAYLSKKAHPFTDSLALQAIELIMKKYSSCVQKWRKMFKQETKWPMLLCWREWRFQIHLLL